MTQLEMAQEKEIKDLREKFKKRTIAYGMAKKAADSRDSEIAVLNGANKVLAQGLVEILKAVRDMESCDACKQKYMDMSIFISKSNPTALRYAMQYLNAEDTFYFMKLLDDPDKTFQEQEALAKLMKARKG